MALLPILETAKGSVHSTKLHGMNTTQVTSELQIWASVSDGTPVRRCFSLLHFSFVFTSQGLAWSLVNHSIDLRKNLMHSAFLHLIFTMQSLRRMLKVEQWACNNWTYSTTLPLLPPLLWSGLASSFQWAAQPSSKRELSEQTRFLLGSLLFWHSEEGRFIDFPKS